MQTLLHKTWMQVKYSPFEPKGEKVQRMLFLTYISGGKEATLIIKLDFCSVQCISGFLPQNQFLPFVYFLLF